MSGTVSIFGIPVARITQDEAIERIVALARRPKEGPPAQIATLNVDFVSNAVSCWPFRGNDELWDILRKADLVTADGMPIVLLSRLLRAPVPGRATGSDMTPAICRRCAEEGLSIYILGGNREAIEEALAKLAAARDPATPPLRVAGIDDSIFQLEDDPSEIIGRINAASPDLLFVAMSNPKQELWMGRNAARLRASAMIGVGGTFNFLAGRVKRAPRWVQRCGLEWVYRIIQEPKRLWRRYAYGLAKFSWLSLQALLGRKFIK